MGEKEKYKKHDDNYKYMYIWSIIIHDRETFTVLLQIEFYRFVFFLWLCINERNAEIKTTGFLPLVACLTFGIIQDISCLRLMTYRSCWAKILNCQHMGAIRWITNNKGNTPGLSQTPSKMKHGTTLQRSSTGI